MLLRTNKNINEILNGYDAAIQFLLDNKIRFVYQTCTVFIKADRGDLVKLLKYLFRYHRKFYYYLSKPSNRTHSIENKIFHECESFYNSEYFYIY